MKKKTPYYMLWLKNTVKSASDVQHSVTLHPDDTCAAGGVPCGGRKPSPRESSIEQILFYFSSLRLEDIF